MKKSVLISSLALLCAIGCQKEIEAPIETTDSSAPTYSAVIEETIDATKTILDPYTKNIHWLKGDQIAVFDHSTAPQKYQIDDADHLQTHGTFRKVVNTDGSLIVGTETNALVAFYPYLNLQLFAEEATTPTYQIRGYELPAIQNCIEPQNESKEELMKAYPCQLPMMYAQTELEDYINFKNVLGILCLNIRGNGSIQKIIFRGNSEEIICGLADIYIDQTGIPDISVYEGNKKEITLNCGPKGYLLDSKFEQEFPIALPPTIFQNGFTCDIYMMDGKVETVQAKGQQEIKRSRILNMPPIEVGNFAITFDNNIANIDDNLTKTVTVNSAKAWKIASTLPSWLTIDKMSYDPFPETTTTVTLTAQPLSDPERTAEIIFDNGKERSTLIVKQTTNRLYFNNFDKTPVTNTYGPTGTYWPYMGQNKGWENYIGIAITPNIIHENSSVTTRNIDHSDLANYSSGVNHLYFAKNGKLIIKGLDITGCTNVQLEFAASRYLFDSVNGVDPNHNVTPDKFKVYLGNDGEKWVEVNYLQNQAVTPSAEWQAYKANLTLPAGTKDLYLAFKNVPTTGEGFRMDDLKLMKATETGTMVDFNTAVLVDGISPKAPVAGAIFSEDFFTAPTDWTIENKNMPAPLTEIWTHITFNKHYMKATGFLSGTKYATESWLISPVIDLAGQTTASLSFDQAVNYLGGTKTSGDHIAVYVGNEAGTSWTQQVIPNLPAGSSWNFTNSGNIDLSAYAGQRIKIAFVYTSYPDSAPTWEVNNVLVSPTAKPIL